MKKALPLIILSTLHGHASFGTEKEGKSQKTVFTNNTLEERKQEIDDSLSEYKDEVKRNLTDFFTKKFESLTYNPFSVLEITEMKIQTLREFQKNISNSYQTQEYLRGLKDSFKDLNITNIPERTEEDHSKHWITLIAIDELIFEIEKDRMGKL